MSQAHPAQLTKKFKLLELYSLAGEAKGPAGLWSLNNFTSPRSYLLKSVFDFKWPKISQMKCKNRGYK